MNRFIGLSYFFAPDLVKLIKENIQDSATKAILYDYLLRWGFEQYDTVGIDEEFDKMATEGNTPYDGEFIYPKEFPIELINNRMIRINE